MDYKLSIISLDELESVSDKFSGIYFGSEFCQELLPTLSDIKQIISFASDRDLSLHLVTPYLTNEKLNYTTKVIDYLLSEKLNPEVIVNEWGLLRVICSKYNNIEPILGRILSRQKSDPRMEKFIMKAFDRQEALELIEGFKEIGLNTSYLSPFFSKSGIKRIELNNVRQGIKLSDYSNFKFSLHIPYVFVSSTRFCPTTTYHLEQETGEKMIEILDCKMECRNLYFELSSGNFEGHLYLHGNTMFYRNDDIEKAPPQIDRIVVHNHPM